MAARVIGAFGVLAFVLVAAGLSVMIVATRRREIGESQRAQAIGLLIVGSAMRLVVAGLAGGIVVALAAE